VRRRARGRGARERGRAGRVGAKATDALWKRLRRTDGVAYAEPDLAKLVAVKFMNSKGKGSTSDAIDGIDYAVKNGAKIVNCSFGSSSKSSALRDAVDYAQDHNVLLVVASGNDGENIDKNPVYPASYTDSNILAVAASTDTDTLASFSRHEVDKPPALAGKVAYDGRLNVQKALAAIPGLVD